MRRVYGRRLLCPDARVLTVKTRVGARVLGLDRVWVRETEPRVKSAPRGVSCAMAPSAIATGGCV